MPREVSILREEKSVYPRLVGGLPFPHSIDFNHSAVVSGFIFNYIYHTKMVSSTFYPLAFVYNELVYVSFIIFIADNQFRHPRNVLFHKKIQEHSVGTWFLNPLTPKSTKKSKFKKNAKFNFVKYWKNKWDHVKALPKRLMHWWGMGNDRLRLFLYVNDSLIFSFVPDLWIFNLLRFNMASKITADYFPTPATWLITNWLLVNVRWYIFFEKM